VPGNSVPIPVSRWTRPGTVHCRTPDPGVSRIIDDEDEPQDGEQAKCQGCQPRHLPRLGEGLEQLGFPQVGGACSGNRPVEIAGRRLADVGDPGGSDCALASMWCLYQRWKNAKANPQPPFIRSCSA
jgi:hypothetical protein